MNSQLTIDGNVHLEIRNAKTGELVDEQRVKNKVVAGGRNVVRDLLCNVEWAPRYLACGESSTAVTDLDTGLETETYRNAFTRTVPSESKVTYQMHVLATQGNGGTWREIGLFRGSKRLYTTEAGGTPAGGGTLFARAIISPIIKTEDITVTINWDINLQSAS